MPPKIRGDGSRDDDSDTDTASADDESSSSSSSSGGLTGRLKDRIRSGARRHGGSGAAGSGSTPTSESGGGAAGASPTDDDVDVPGSEASASPEETSPTGDDGNGGDLHGGQVDSGDSTSGAGETTGTQDSGGSPTDGGGGGSDIPESDPSPDGSGSTGGGLHGGQVDSGDSTSGAGGTTGTQNNVGGPTAGGESGRSGGGLHGGQVDGDDSTSGAGGPSDIGGGGGGSPSGEVESGRGGFLRDPEPQDVVIDESAVGYLDEDRRQRAQGLAEQVASDRPGLDPGEVRVKAISGGGFRVLGATEEGRRDMARQQIANQNENLDEGDFTLTQTEDGGFGVELTGREKRERARQQVANQNEGLDEGDFTVSVGDDGSVDVALTEEGKREQARAQLQEEFPDAKDFKISVDEDGVTGRPIFGVREEDVGMGDQPTGRIATPGDGPDIRTSTDAGGLPDIEDRLKAQIARVHDEIDPDDVTVRRQTDELESPESARQGHREPTYEATLATEAEAEQFGDIDWSFGLGGEGDEVEQGLGDASTAVSEGSRNVANELFKEKGVAGRSAGEELLGAAGREDLGRAYEENLRSLGKGTVEGVGALANMPALAKSGLEGVEYVGYGANKTRAGEFSEFKEQSLDRGGVVTSAAVQQAASNPAKTTGLLAGSLAGSYGIMSTASKIGPRAGLASRAVIQPGEEALGYAGYYTTKAATSAKTANKVFPGKEPLIFSEEAALAGAKKAGSRLGDLSPSSRLRTATGAVTQRTPTARVVKDPDAGLVSVDSELSRDIGGTYRQYRDALATRATKPTELSGDRVTNAARAVAQAPGAAARRAGAGAASRVDDAMDRMPSTSRQPSGPAVQHALLSDSDFPGGLPARPKGDFSGSLPSRPDLNVRSRARAAADTASDLPERIAQTQHRYTLALKSDLQERASGVNTRYRQARSRITNAELPDLSAGGGLTADGRQGVAPLVRGAQRPSIEGGVARATNVLAFETRRRGLQATQTASDLPGRIADARRQYAFALKSDFMEAGSGVDTRYRQARSRIKDAELPDGPSARRPEGLLPDLGDYTLRIGGPAEARSGGESTGTQAELDASDFEGFDVEGVLGSEFGDIESELDTDTETDTETELDDMDSVDRDAGDGVVALETRTESETEPMDTGRTGTGTDSMGRARELPISRPLATAFDSGGMPDETEPSLPSGEDLAGGQPEIGTEFGEETRVQRSLRDEGGFDSWEETGFDTDQDVWTGSETDQTFEPTGDQEIDADTELGLDTELDQEFEMDQELELETEQEQELEAELELFGESDRDDENGRSLFATESEVFDTGVVQSIGELEDSWSSNENSGNKDPLSGLDKL